MTVLYTKLIVAEEHNTKQKNECTNSINQESFNLLAGLENKLLLKSCVLYAIMLMLLIIESAYLFADNDEELKNLLNTTISQSELFNQRISESPNSIIIISKEQIKLFGYVTVAELISTIQGTYTRNDMNYEFLGTRGFDRPSSFSNNLVLLNGHVLNEYVYGSQSLDNYLGIDMDDISRVEILQGSSSSIYGSGAMVSLINIVLKDGKEFDGLTAGMMYGTFDNKYAHLSYGKKFDELSLAVTGRYGDRAGIDFYFEDFRSEESDGIARNMDWEKHIGSTIQAQYRDFSLNMYFSNREKSIPNAPYQSDFNTAPTKSCDSRAFYSLMYQKAVNPVQSLKARLYYDTYDYTDVFQYSGDPVFTENIGRWFGLEFDYKWDISTSYSFLAGSNITHAYILSNKLYDNYEFYSKSDLPFSLASFYVQNNYQFTRNFSIDFGLRADVFSYYTPHYNPRIAVIYNPTENTTLKYLLNSGFRIPSIYELFVDDTTFKSENLNLRPENLISNEIIWENVISKYFNYSIAMYYYRFRNIIELVPVPDLPDYGGSYKNMPYYNSLGIELALRGRPEAGFVWYSNFAYQLSNDSAGKQITNSPQILIKAGIAYSIFENLFFGIEGKYESNRRTFYDTFTDDFFLLDANIGFSPNFAKESGFAVLNSIHLGLRAKNLLGIQYFLPGPNWVSTQSVEQYGRVVTLIIRAKV